MLIGDGNGEVGNGGEDGALWKKETPRCKNHIFSEWRKL